MTTFVTRASRRSECLHSARLAVAEMRDDRRRRDLEESVEAQDGDRVGERRRVRSGRSRSDHVERIADHVGDDQPSRRVPSSPARAARP